MNNVREVLSSGSSLQRILSLGWRGAFFAIVLGWAAYTGLLCWGDFDL